MTLMSIFLGLLLVAGGILYAYFGLRVFKFFLPILALFAGIELGMYLGDEAGFGAVAQFLLAALLGLGLGLASFFIWKAAVVISFFILGYSMSIFLLSLLNIDAPVMFVIIGLLTAAVFAAFAIMAGIWNYLVVVATSFQGASLAILGILAVFEKGFVVYLPYLTEKNVFADLNPVVTILLVTVFVIVAVSGMMFQVQVNPEFETMEY